MTIEKRTCAAPFSHHTASSCTHIPVYISARAFSFFHRLPQHECPFGSREDILVIIGICSTHKCNAQRRKKHSQKHKEKCFPGFPRNEAHHVSVNPSDKRDVIQYRQTKIIKNGLYVAAF